MRFIGVSFGVIDRKLVCIATSENYSVIEPNGLSTKEALAFLVSIAVIRERVARMQSRTESRPVLVMYDSAIDLELLLQDLRPHQKDVLFGLYRAKEDKNKDNPLYDPMTPEYKGVVTTCGFKVSALPGKILRVAQIRRAGLVFYDIAGYFDGIEINEANKKFLGMSVIKRIEKNILPLWQAGLAEAIGDRCEDEAKLIVRLADKVNEVIEPLEIKPRQWYGPSAIAARCLHKWEARKQAKRLNEKNSPYEMIKAIDCAYFGGRVELIKNGKVQDVRTFDLNSAYAYATTLLSQFHTSLRFTRTYQSDAPFSCWLVQYDLPDDTTLGVLPTRLGTGGISFRRGGKGYFWQPEVDYLARTYPDSYRVFWGYVGPEHQPVTFAQAIRDMYTYRNELKARDDAGESIIKLALSNLYGKFAQNSGSAHFQCRAWAGWITSFIRRLLLEAVTGLEDRVICFCQDAVHLQGVNASMPIGDGLGEWKTKQFASGLYLSPGIYDLYESNINDSEHKIATRGSNCILDFERIAKDLSERQVAELARTFFVGWTLSRQMPGKFGGHYLKDIEEKLSLIPSRLNARSYLAQFDWLNECRNSRINARVIGQSARYIPNETGHIAALRLKLKDRGWA